MKHEHFTGDRWVCCWYCGGCGGPVYVVLQEFRHQLGVHGYLLDTTTYGGQKDEKEGKATRKKQKAYEIKENRIIQVVNSEPESRISAKNGVNIGKTATFYRFLPTFYRFLPTNLSLSSYQFSLFYFPIFAQYQQNAGVSLEQSHNLRHKRNTALNGAKGGTFSSLLPLITPYIPLLKERK